MRPTDAEMPEKRYFRIGEVSAITGIEPYVLRYWQTEFAKISPTRSRSGQRLYRRRDIEAILEIKHLLYKKRFTIAGAKRYLRGSQQVASVAHDDSQPLTLQALREELIAIRNLLNR
ncbi:MAG: MerR family transcriptional regulator [Thermodesulfobacteriota bacterium]|nr:MerR family transcriptional regulator [Thermodesulfobacteriota bacterium]